MGWGDVLGAISSAGAGVNQAYQFKKELESKERIAKLQDEMRQMIAQIGAKAKTDVADINSEAKRRHDEAAKVIEEMRQAGNTQRANSKDEKDKIIAKWKLDNHITETEMILLNRMTLADFNAKAAQKRVETQQTGATNRAGIAANARVQSAGIAAQGARDVAQTNQGGQNYRFNTEFPLRVMRANQGNYPRGSAAASSIFNSGGDVTKPAFGPSYQDMMKTNPPLAPSPGTSAPLSSPQFQFGTPARPSPLAPQTTAPPVSFAPSSAMPKEEPGMDLPDLPEPPEPDMPEPLAPQAQEPLAAQGSFFTGLQPAPGGASNLKDQRLDQQATELISRVLQLQRAGKFREAEALKQQLADMLKQ